MNIDWQKEWELFYGKFITYGGYKTVLDGLVDLEDRRIRIDDRHHHRYGHRIDQDDPEV